MNQYLLPVLGAFALLSSSAFASELVPGPIDTEKLVHAIYQPSYHRFAESANQSVREIEGLCSRASASSIYKMQTTFTGLVTDYSSIELYRLGPLLKNQIQHRLFYWPDKRRVGERQLRTLLTDPDILKLDANELAEKSVALQGFSALERLLFSSQYLPIEAMPQCHVAQVIIQNIAAMANQLNHAWSTDSNIVQAVVSPGLESAYFRNEKEIVRSVMTQIITGLDVVLNRKLKPLLSDELRTVKKAPLWKSQRTVSMLRGNLASIEALLLDSKLIAQTTLEEQLRIEFKYVNHLLDRSKFMVSYSDENGRLTAEAEVLFNSLFAVVGSISYSVNTQLPRLLGVVAFNSSEGD